MTSCEGARLTHPPGRFPGPVAGDCEAALNALTITLAADTPVLVNAVCPGLTATWPGAESLGARPVAEGAASSLWAVTCPTTGRAEQRATSRQTAPALVTPLLRDTDTAHRGCWPVAPRM